MTIDDYILVALAKLALRPDQITLSFQNRFEMDEVLRNLIVRALKPYPPASIYDPAALADKVFQNFVTGGVIEVNEDPVAGAYYRIVYAAFETWRAVTVSEGTVAKRAQIVGARFLGDAFSNYFDGNVTSSKLDGRFVERDVDIPASDRIVTLSHNQQAELDGLTTSLIETVEQENSIEGDPSLRSRVVGQLKAGRELVRAQTFRAYLLYSSVVTLLSGLIGKYRGRAIGIAAEKLLELLIESVFKS